MIFNMGRHKKYNTEEERLEARRESHRRYQSKFRKNHPDYDAEWRKANSDYHSEYYQEHKEYFAEYGAKYRQKYRQTPKGRAAHLISSYAANDRLYKRGECTLTAEWIVENIFSQPCHYCGETDWRKLGCDRIDNTLPHTPENVVSCCRHCNCKKHTTSYDEFVEKT